MHLSSCVSALPFEAHFLRMGQSFCRVHPDTTPWHKFQFLISQKHKACKDAPCSCPAVLQPPLHPCCSLLQGSFRTPRPFPCRAFDIQAIVLILKTAARSCRFRHSFKVPALPKADGRTIGATLAVRPFAGRLHCPGQMFNNHCTALPSGAIRPSPSIRIFPHD